MHQLLVFGSAFSAGMINSVAGGGTLLSFPTLIWPGVPSVAANATSTVALWPGSVGSAWGHRRELRDTDRTLFALSVAAQGGHSAAARSDGHAHQRPIAVAVVDDALSSRCGALRRLLRRRHRHPHAGGVRPDGAHRRMGRTAVRRIIIAIGFGVALALLVRAL